MDGDRRVALVETNDQDASAAGVFKAKRRTRYQLIDPLGTSILEIAEDGQNVISYEEMYPYGESSVRIEQSSAGFSLKTYRYNGKERDDQTGLYYFGARYYAALGRWTSADPAGLVDGLNLYMYARNRPTVLMDTAGLSATFDPESSGHGGDPQPNDFSYNQESAWQTSPTDIEYVGKEQIEQLERLVNEFGAATGSVVKWNKPSRMPRQLYEGIVAHLQIAADFIEKNPPGTIITNYMSTDKILFELGLGPRIFENKVLKPDIVDVGQSPWRVWEIKSEKEGRVAASLQMEQYRNALGAGVYSVPGPTNAPGASGEKMTIAGRLNWNSPSPGVILYSFGNQTRRESPKNVTHDFSALEKILLVLLAAAAAVLLGPRIVPTMEPQPAGINAPFSYPSMRQEDVSS